MRLHETGQARFMRVHETGLTRFMGETDVGLTSWRIGAMLLVCTAGVW
jgi:hypothetical protein